MNRDRVKLYRNLGVFTAAALIQRNDGEWIWRYRDGWRHPSTFDYPRDFAANLDEFITLVEASPRFILTSFDDFLF